MKLIEGRDLTLGYEGQGIVSDLSFSVDEGDYLCIVGENGSGKSTFAKTVLGLVEPLRGSIDRISAADFGNPARFPILCHGGRAFGMPE